MSYGKGPSLQASSVGLEPWLRESKEAIDLCDKVQNFYWRVIFKVPESCPKVSLRSETNMLGIKWRVWEEKVFLLMRIENHEEDTLCSQIYEEGKSRGWPGLGKDVSDICKTIDIPDVNETLVPKSVVKTAIFNHRYKEIKTEIDSMNKLEPIRTEDFREHTEIFHG